MADSPSPRAEWDSLDRSPGGIDDEADPPQNEEHESALPPTDTRRPIPPPLSDEQLVFAAALARDLLEIKRAHSKFATFGDERVSDSAHLLVRYGLESVEACRTTDEQARRFLSKTSVRRIN